MRLSGSVKLRCALPSGSAFGGVAGLPALSEAEAPVFLPPSALRLSSAAARALLSASAAARAWA